MRRKICFVGISGLDLNLLRYLAKTKQMPFFSEILLEGSMINFARNDLSDVDPWRKYLLYREYIKQIPADNIHTETSEWVSLLSGISPEKHKIISGLIKNRRNIFVPASYHFRKASYFWEEMADKTDLGIIGWPVDWPVKNCNYYHIPHLYDGFILSGRKKKLNNMKLFTSSVWDRVKDIKIPAGSQKFMERINVELYSCLGLEIAGDGLYIEWAKRLISIYGQPDVLAICLHSLHNLSHLFWDCLSREKKYFKGAVHNKRRKKYGDIVTDYYIYLDKMLNSMIKLINKNTLLFTVSPFGMARSNILKKYLLMNGIYNKLGFLHYKANGEINWAKTVVYDDGNPWGIFAIRKGYIKSNKPLELFHRLRWHLKNIKIDNNSLFADINFNKKDNSFSIVPDYKNIHYSSKINIKNKEYPAGKFIKFIPHYSLHGEKGALITNFKVNNKIKNIYEAAGFVKSFF